LFILMPPHLILTPGAPAHAGDDLSVGVAIEPGFQAASERRHHEETLIVQLVDIGGGTPAIP
jgi:hypothetical protein